jgi:hypothetical protein
MARTKRAYTQDESDQLERAKRKAQEVVRAFGAVVLYDASPLLTALFRRTGRRSAARV